jgi:hypothetical protein
MDFLKLTNPWINIVLATLQASPILRYDLQIQPLIIICDCNGAGIKSLTYRCPPTANNDSYDLLTEAYMI